MTVLLPRKDLPRDFADDEDQASVRRAKFLDCRLVWDVVDAATVEGGKSDGLGLLLVLERVIRRDPGMTVREFADAVSSLRARGYLKLGRGPGYRVTRTAERPDGPRAFFADPRTAGDLDQRLAEQVGGPSGGGSGEDGENLPIDHEAVQVGMPPDALAEVSPDPDPEAGSSAGEIPEAEQPRAVTREDPVLADLRSAPDPEAPGELTLTIEEVSEESEAEEAAK